MDRWRNEQNFQGSDAALLAELVAHNEAIGLGHLNALPGRPRAPSTMQADLDDAGPTLAELRAANDKRDRELVAATKRRQAELESASGEVDDQADDDAEPGHTR
jgi:hypothetical protein